MDQEFDPIENEMCDFFKLVTIYESELPDSEPESGLSLSQDEQLLSTVKAFIKDFVANVSYFLSESFLSEKEQLFEEKLREFDTKYGKVGKMGIIVLAASRDSHFFQKLLHTEIFNNRLGLSLGLSLGSNIYISFMCIILKVLHQQLLKEIEKMRKQKRARHVQKHTHRNQNGKDLDPRINELEAISMCSSDMIVEPYWYIDLTIQDITKIREYVEEVFSEM